MPKKINYQLDEHQLEAIENAQKSGASPEIRMRATSIRLLHRDKKPSEVAELLNVSLATVYNWHERFRAGGIAGLADEPRRGRPPTATPEYCQKLEAVIQTDPSELGYAFTIWTIQRLLEHMQTVTGISLSDDTLRAVLERHNFVYRRPKHDLRPLQDPAARQRAVDLLELLKKRPKPARSNYSLWTKAP